MTVGFDGPQKEASSPYLDLSVGIEIPIRTPHKSWGAQTVFLFS